MFWSKQSDTISWRLDRVSSSTIVIQLDNPIWKYAKLPNIDHSLIDYIESQVIIDLSNVRQMTTAAFVILLMMKNQLQEKGSTVCIRGLHGQPKSLCEVLKLNDLLFSE